MALKEKSMSDYEKVITALKNTYTKNKMTFGWDFIECQETLGNNKDLHCFTIVNQFEAAKVIYSEELKTIIQSEMPVRDIETIYNMVQQLKGGTSND